MSTLRPAYIKIGNLGRSVGKLGEIRMNFSGSQLEDMQQLEHIFLGLEGQKVPYFIEYIKDDGDNLIKFDDIHHPEDANKLTNVEMFVSEAQANQIGFTQNVVTNELVGFTIANQYEEMCGEITRLVEYPQQSMAFILTPTGEKMIPMVEDWIMDIDPTKKIIYMELPSGLLGDEEE